MRTTYFRTSITTALALLTSTYAKIVKVEPNPSPGCHNSISHDTLAEISTKLQNRPIKVTLPPSYSPKKPNPLILVYNDRDVKLEDMVEYTGLSDGEVNKEAVVVYVAPQKGVRIIPEEQERLLILMM
jgi:hypothetical protein